MMVCVQRYGQTAKRGLFAGNARRSVRLAELGEPRKRHFPCSQHMACTYRSI